MMESKPSCCTAARNRLNVTAPTPAAGQAALPGITIAESEKDRMVQLPGGLFLMGTSDQEANPYDGEGPVREVNVNAFAIAPYTVTNSDFVRFIQATGYRTDAEQFGWSYVFHLFLTEQAAAATQAPAHTPWWRAVPGADWAHPEGPGSSLVHRMDHPVVHVSWNDADAYCKWAGVRLPTEAEWEYAARGGLVQKRYPWGDELKPAGEFRCNIWQGRFPVKNHASDGYPGTAPVGAYCPNGYGLYQMSGNVWEWCSDWYDRSYDVTGHTDNPKGPLQGQERVMRGGSYLCHRSYCNRYRVAARNKNTPDSSSSHVGFRCVKDMGYLS
ncbi:formylglycine-generating enzyme family protein [Bifidobacterium pullorum subsp. gallinarum]